MLNPFRTGLSMKGGTMADEREQEGGNPAPGELSDEQLDSVSGGTAKEDGVKSPRDASSGLATGRR